MDRKSQPAHSEFSKRLECWKDFQVQLHCSARAAFTQPVDPNAEVVRQEPTLEDSLVFLYIEDN